MAATASLSMRQVERLAGLTRASLTTLIRAGVVQPVAGRFELRDITVLRSARALRDAQVPTHKLVRALVKALESLPRSTHLSSVSIRANGTTVEFADREGWLDALSGQRALPFTSNAALQPVTVHPLLTAEDWYDHAHEWDDLRLPGALAALRSAIGVDPTFAPAYIDLSAVLCEEGHCADALAVLDDALAHVEDTAMIQFNRAVALEDLERLADAADAYRRALELDPSHADAHCNMALLADRTGDKQSALRHFAAYRRLTEQRLSVP